MVRLTVGRWLSGAGSGRHEGAHDDLRDPRDPRGLRRGGAVRPDPETALAGGLALRGVAQSRVRSVVRIHGDRLHLDADAVSERTPEAEMIEMIINEDITYLELRPLLHHFQGFRERDEVYAGRD
jgi:hypothetical protein